MTSALDRLRSTLWRLFAGVSRQLESWLKRHRIARTRLRSFQDAPMATHWLMQPHLSEAQRRLLVGTGDPIRYGTLLLAFEQLSKDQIPGSLAECGVYRGWLSKFIHNVAPERRLFLFDTFGGFDSRDVSAHGDERFRDTSVQSVLEHIGSAENIVVRKGYFPETTVGLEDERFAFVMIDFDKYEPTLAALEFFYSRVSRGGFVFVHDYNSPESDWSCSRALDGFLADKVEEPICIPDPWGSALFRKL
jgi:O-methyltransferase